jgi:hypothetical protein
MMDLTLFLICAYNGKDILDIALVAAVKEI